MKFKSQWVVDAAFGISYVQNTELCLSLSIITVGVHGLSVVHVSFLILEAWLSLVISNRVN